MSAYERRLLRKQINRKLYYMSNKESQENDFLNSSQMITERQHMYMVIEKHFREKENKRTSKKRIPFPIENTSLPHVNLGRTNRIFNITKAITSKSDEIDKVLNAHAYRTATPYYTNPELTVERGNFMNYSQHIGTLLHTPRYIEFLKTLRESKSSRSEKKTNYDCLDYVSSSSSEQTSNSHKTYTKSKSSNSSTSNKTLERKKRNITEDSDSISLNRELSSTSLSMSKSSGNSSALSNNEKVSTKRSSSVLSPSENQFQDSSIKKGPINPSRVSQEKRTYSSRNSFLVDKNKNDNISQASGKSDIEEFRSDSSFQNKNEKNGNVNNDQEYLVKDDRSKSELSNKLSEKRNFYNEVESSTDLTRSDENNKRPCDKIISSNEIQHDEDLKPNVADAYYENDDTSGQIDVDITKNDQRTSPNLGESILINNKDEKIKTSEHEDFFNETQNDFSIKNNESKIPSQEEKESPEIPTSDDEMFHFEMNNNSKTNFVSEMEEFLYNNDIEPEEGHHMKSYFNTVYRFQLTNQKYVKDYYKFSAKHNQGNFITFAKICNRHPIHSLSNYEVKRITRLIEDYSNINSIEKRNENNGDNSNNKSTEVTEIPNGDKFEETMSELKSSQVDESQNDPLKKNTEDNEEIKFEEKKWEEIQGENICPEENVAKDEDEDFSEAFEKLFKNSIAEISKEDLKAIKRLAENFKPIKTNMNEEEDSSAMGNDKDLLLNDTEIPRENSVSVYNEKEKDEKSVVYGSRKLSKDNINNQNETKNSTTTIDNECIENKETESLKLNREIDSPFIEDSKIESEEENEILRNFRNLFRTSIDNIKDEDLEKVQQLIEDHAKQYDNL